MGESQWIQLGAAVAILWLVTQILRTVFKFVREDLKTGKGSAAPSPVMNDMSQPISLLAHDRDFLRDHLAEVRRTTAETSRQMDQMQRQLMDIRQMLLRIEYGRRRAESGTYPRGD